MPVLVPDQSGRVGQEIYDFARRYFPIPRSLTGAGVRQSLELIRTVLPELVVHEVPSGTRAFDWVVPEEWRVDEAYVEDEAGRRIVDVHRNNLHLVGYSVPVDRRMGLGELEEHLHSLEALPDAVPYVTSYYERRWGFCLPHRQRASLGEGTYHVLIRSELFAGSLSYGELILPGQTEEEVFLSSYICHPSLANNESSGPSLLTFLGRYLRSLPVRRYTYRIVFAPETLGPIVYLSRNLAALKRNVRAAFNVNCVGDERAVSFLPSRLGTTLADRVARHVLSRCAPDFIEYSFLADRGSDERQYCSPGVDLPLVSIMRSMYGTYPEYHTSLDDLDFISPTGLEGSFFLHKRCLDLLEANRRYQPVFLCEPQFGRRGLKPTLAKGRAPPTTRKMMDILAYCDGEHDLVALAERLGDSAWELQPVIASLLEHGLLKPAEP